MGRGEYYKNKYGRGGRGGGGGANSGGNGRGGRGRGRGGRGGGSSRDGGRVGGSFDDLRRLLEGIDGRQYPCYHDIETNPAQRGWVNQPGGFSLYVGRAQSDPFAPPTRCKVVVNASMAQFPPALYSNKIRRVALTDYLQRSLYNSCKRMGADNSLAGGKGWSGPKGGDIQVMEPCQHILEQSAVTMDQGNVHAQVTINLPARGRTILGQAALEILDPVLSELIRTSLLYSALDSKALHQHVDSVEDQFWLQNQLDENGLVAFIRNGAILPRASGVDDKPMTGPSIIPFESPRDLQVSFHLPNAATTIQGLGIRKGVTLICGGGFHGKSTILQAIQLGVYLKVPGDGREFCVTSPKAMKIRAEDGRCVTSVDISLFINNLPFGKDTTCFSTPDASGSTSQASNIVEAIEAGVNTLLIDEDTCATNFMIRDEKMMQLVAVEKEPITPFVSMVRSMYQDMEVSSILVIGGSGDYFDVADTVLLMDSYTCEDATDRAKQIVDKSHSKTVTTSSSSPPRKRFPVGEKYQLDGKVKVMSREVVSYSETEIVLSGLEQIVTKSQTNAIVGCLQKLSTLASRGSKPMKEVLDLLEKTMDTEGLETLAPGQFHGGLARPRLLEIAGAINRVRRGGNLIQK